MLYYEEGALTKRQMKDLQRRGHRLEAWKQIGRFQGVSTRAAAPDRLRSGDSKGHFKRYVR